MGGIGLDFLAELFDEGPEIFGVFAVLGSPYRAQDFPVGDGFVGMVGKIVQDFKFLGRKPHVFSIDGYATAPGSQFRRLPGELFEGPIRGRRHSGGAPSESLPAVPAMRKGLVM